MAFFKSRPRTAQQKAQRAQMRIFVRLACCAYIAYYIIRPLITDEANASGDLSPALRLAVIIGFSVITALIFIATIFELVRSWKAGVFKASSYSDDTAADAVSAADLIEDGDGEEPDALDDAGEEAGTVEEDGTPGDSGGTGSAEESGKI